jgi:hypothetical protein
MERRGTAPSSGPTTNLSAHISAILYFDDTDLLHINFDHDKSINNPHAAIQNSVNSWRNLIIATGGALNPEKCFYSIISFEWVRGVWKYKDNSINGRFGVTVPLPGGFSTAITHCPVSHAEKNTQCYDFSRWHKLQCYTTDAGESAAMGICG